MFVFLLRERHLMDIFVCAAPTNVGDTNLPTRAPTTSAPTGESDACAMNRRQPPLSLTLPRPTAVHVM
jgi:hypothetical protein